MDRVQVQALEPDGVFLIDWVLEQVIDQESGSRILLRNAETGCGMADVSLEETVNFFMGLLASLNKEQRA